MILELVSVSRSFGRLTVCNEISLSLEAGAALGILGPNGAGKTTLLNLISGDLPVTSGRIWFQGEDVTAVPAYQRCRRGIARTFQIPRPFSAMTVFENVLVAAAYGSSQHEQASHDPGYAVLELTGLLQQANVMAGNLRLLDRKRLELARALATQPVLLLLDEIAGGLIDQEVLHLLDVIAAIRKQGITIIWIEHIVHALVSSVDRIMAINFGVKLGEGKPDEIINSPAFQEIYFGIGSTVLKGKSRVTTALTIANIEVFYGEFQALFGVSLEVEQGSTAAIIGANGAGKTTLMRAICGMLTPRSGHILYQGRLISGQSPFRLNQQGIGMVPEGRNIFPSLTVEENLKIGAYSQRKGLWDLKRIYELFPMLKAFARSGGTDLSGGQQQMLAIGRALMSNPDLILMDEISLGLAPIVVQELYRVVDIIAESGATVILVEQDVSRAIKAADYVYCLLEGRVSLSGSPAEIGGQDVSRAYFGV